jgi:CRP-like cAMP-binding protein
VTLKQALLQMVEGSAERQALDAGEIDAIIDHADSNVILLPGARRALREVGNEAAIANRLLAGLPREEYRLLLPGLEPVTLRLGEVIQEPGVLIRHVYFPVDCTVRILASVGDDRTMEVGLVGREGMVGASFVLGAQASSVRARVDESGTAMRMKVALFDREFRRCTRLQQLLYRYADDKLALARQAVACNQFHSLQARLARCLLLTSDRVLAKELALTQEVLAGLLGVRRGAINAAVVPLQSGKLIGYVRGKIRILDRKGLEAAACSCYRS